MSENEEDIEIYKCTKCKTYFSNEIIAQIEQKRRNLYCEYCGEKIRGRDHVSRIPTTTNNTGALRLDRDPEKPIAEETTNLQVSEDTKKEENPSEALLTKEGIVQQFNIFVVRRAYEVLKEFQYDIEMEKDQKEPDSYQLKELAGILRKKITCLPFEKDWLAELSPANLKAFSLYSKFLTKFLKNKKFYREHYKDFFEEAILTVYRLIKGLPDESIEEQKRLEILVDLKDAFGFALYVNARDTFEFQLTAFVASEIYYSKTFRESVLQCDDSSGEIDRAVGKFALELFRSFDQQKFLYKYADTLKWKYKVKFKIKLNNLRDEAKDDHVFCESYMDYLKWLTRTVLELVRGVEYSKLDDMKRDILEYLLRTRPFLSDRELQSSFVPNFKIFLCRMMYSEWSNRIRAKRTEARAMAFEDELLVKLTPKKIERDFLFDLIEISQDDFERNYGKFQLKMKRDHIYRAGFNQFVHSLFNVAFKLIRGNYDPKTLSNSEQTILRDLQKFKEAPAAKGELAPFNPDSLETDKSLIRKTFVHGKVQYNFGYAKYRLNNFPLQYKLPLEKFFELLIIDDNFGIFNTKNIMFSCSRLTIKYLSKNASKIIHPLLIKNNLIKEFTSDSQEIPETIRNLLLSAKNVEDNMNEKDMPDKHRHQLLEDLVLLNNENSLAIETPIWDKCFFITGHIDFILFLFGERNLNLIITDYKPNIEEGKEYNFLRYLPQLGMYALLLKKKLGFVNGLNFQCIVFNKSKGWIFKPEILRNEIPKVLRGFYDPIFFTPYKNMFGEVNNYLLTRWDTLFQFDSLNSNNEDFSLFFKNEMKRILDLDHIPSFNDIFTSIYTILNNLKKYNLNEDQLQHINELSLINSLLTDYISSQKKFILKFCNKFRLNLQLFESFPKDNSYDLLLKLFNIHKFCFVISNHSYISQLKLEKKMVDNTRQIIKGLAQKNAQSKSVEGTLKLTHNTINKIITRLWEKYRVHSFGELKKFYIYSNLNKELLLDLLKQGLSYNQIEATFIKNLLVECDDLEEIAHKLKTDIKTIRRKIDKYKYNLPEKKQQELENRHDLKPKVKKSILDLEKIQKITKKLSIGSSKLKNLSNEIFELDLSSREIQIYLILKKIDKDFLNTLFHLNKLSIIKTRLLFIEKLIREGLDKDEICEKLNLSLKQFDRLLKNWGLSKNFSVLQHDIGGVQVPFNNFLIYEIFKNILPKESSDKDLRILANFKRYDLNYYNNLKKKKLNLKEMKQRFLLLLASKNIDSNKIAVIYGFKGRSSLRYEINVLFGKNISLSLLRSIFSKKDISSYLKEIEQLIESEHTIREISRMLKISTWKIEKIIKKYHNKVVSFAQLKTYLAFKKIDPDQLRELENNGVSFDNILIEFILFLLNKKMDLIDISKILNIPLTKLENVIYSNNLI